MRKEPGDLKIIATYNQTKKERRERTFSAASDGSVGENCWKKFSQNAFPRQAQTNCAAAPPRLRQQTHYSVLEPQFACVSMLFLLDLEANRGDT